MGRSFAGRCQDAAKNPSRRFRRCRPVPGALALVDALGRAGAAVVVVPEHSVVEAKLVAGVEVRSARSLVELRACLKGEAPWPSPPDPRAGPDPGVDDDPLDLAEVRGLASAREGVPIYLVVKFPLTASRRTGTAIT